MGFGSALEEIPDLPEPIIAWRRWSFRREFSLLEDWDGKWYDDVRHAWVFTGELQGVNGVVWRQGTQEAVCRDNEKADLLGRIPRCTETPSKVDSVHSEGYGCGFYGWKTPELLVEYDNPVTYNANVRSESVIGTVWLWGRVMEHENGWRSQFASIRSLCMVNAVDTIEPHTKNFLEKFARSCRYYDVMWEDFPITITEDMIPEVPEWLKRHRNKKAFHG